jgi:hypothetical protein
MEGERVKKGNHETVDCVTVETDRQGRALLVRLIYLDAEQ